MNHKHPATLHIYAQHAWHCPARIKGNEEGLKRLKYAIEDALEHGSGSCAVFCSDGEGYQVVVTKSDDIFGWEMPYLAEYARGIWDEK